MKINTISILAFLVLLITSCIPETLNYPAYVFIYDEQTKEKPFAKQLYREYEIVIDLKNCREDENIEVDVGKIKSDPIFFALCVAGYPNIYGDEPSMVGGYYSDPDNVVVIITSDGKWNPSDSVQSWEYRIDLLRANGNWEVIWEGVRWKCKQNRGQKDWAPEICK